MGSREIIFYCAGRDLMGKLGGGEETTQQHRVYELPGLFKNLPDSRI